MTGVRVTLPLVVSVAVNSRQIVDVAIERP
jgi:hypothetical protein